MAALRRVAAAAAVQPVDVVDEVTVAPVRTNAAERSRA
jgi:hypothetical protein